MQEIKLNDTISVYKTTLEYNKEEIIKEIYYNIDFNEYTSNNDLNITKIVANSVHPGIQSSIMISSKNLEKLKLESIDIIKKYLYKEYDFDYETHSWAYISTNKNKNVKYHSHNSGKEYDWTYVFYVQMPNNLNGDDGKLFFKVEDNEYSLLPKDGELIIFPASLLHTPKLNENSTIDRIVIASNFMKIDINKPIKKNKQTLI
jgi:hypothetical protein